MFFLEQLPTSVQIILFSFLDDFNLCTILAMQEFKELCGYPYNERLYEEKTRMCYSKELIFKENNWKEFYYEMHSFYTYYGDLAAMLPDDCNDHINNMLMHYISNGAQLKLLLQLHPSLKNNYNFKKNLEWRVNAISNITQIAHLKWFQKEFGILPKPHNAIKYERIDVLEFLDEYNIKCGYNEMMFVLERDSIKVFRWLYMKCEFEPRKYFGTAKDYKAQKILKFISSCD